jgi:acetyl-CoA acetyltransferase
MSREVVLVGACRTPVGTFGGKLKDTKKEEFYNESGGSISWCL